jgi:hypothetical protein
MIIKTTKETCHESFLSYSVGDYRLEYHRLCNNSSTRRNHQSREMATGNGGNPAQGNEIIYSVFDSGSQAPAWEPLFPAKFCFAQKLCNPD